MTDRQDLCLEKLKEIQPRYIFFPHWSHIVPNEILETYECVCFHMTDVPYGRGGSPLQNLILRGHESTKLTALRMTDVLDAGPVYCKSDLSLAGSARDIFERTAELVYHQVKMIVENEPEPIPQEGESVPFKRRTPDMSALPEQGTLRELYDHIRMLDAETYPRAFVKHGAFHLSLKDAHFDEAGKLEAKVIISKNPTHDE